MIGETTLVVICCLVAVSSMGVGWWLGYREGHWTGYKAGYEDGEAGLLLEKARKNERREK